MFNNWKKIEFSQIVTFLGYNMIWSSPYKNHLGCQILYGIPNLVKKTASFVLLLFITSQQGSVCPRNPKAGRRKTQNSKYFFITLTPFFCAGLLYKNDQDDHLEIFGKASSFFHYWRKNQCFPIIEKRSKFLLNFNIIRSSPLKKSFWVQILYKKVPG